MVRKLYRHEAFALGRVMLPVSAICLILSGILRISIELGAFDSDEFAIKFLRGLLVTTYVIAIIAVVIIAAALVIVRFYKHLLSNEGYLSFTLPVKTSTHIVCKMICGLICIALSALVTLASLYIVLNGVFDVKEDLSELFEVFIVLKNRVGLTHFVLFGVEFGLLLILSTLQKILQPYAAMALGQKSSKSKIGMAVLWYFISLVAIEILTVVLTSVGTSLDISLLGGIDLERSLPGQIHVFLWLLNTFEAILCAVFYVITYETLNKKLNLE
ncbi:MAG: hypothetical protein MJ096_05385 [Clostridia bacterium]|nr:hypothetical protein [Clostridia bacterium]